MENEKKNTVLSDEDLKNVAGGVCVSQEYCEGHLTAESCRATHVCQWFPGKRFDIITNQWTEGSCVTKGNVEPKSKK
ncbi:MAG: hypothetical protein IKW15_06975 [Bacteroidales bacterium]|nr:hypothetical protein [Bacteroidales bacterium]